MMYLFDRKYSKNSKTLKYYNLKEQISTLIYLKNVIYSCHWILSPFPVNEFSAARHMC